jgi:hypothetical protein
MRKSLSVKDLPWRTNSRTRRQNSEGGAQNQLNPQFTTWPDRSATA